jgi:tetratricopeptide (TPR) repeat protein
MTRRVITVAAFGLLIASAACGDGLSADDRRTLLRQALTEFDNGIELQRTEPRAARAHYTAAAAAYEALVADGIGNAALFFNLGNAYYRAGDLGRAVLNYRRAQRLAPGDERVRANLRLARQQVAPLIAPTPETRLWRQLFFWHYTTSLATRLTIAIALSVLGWAVLALWYWRRGRGWVVLGLLLVVHGLGAATSVALQLDNEASAAPAVIISGRPTLRLGRGEGQDAALAEPLGPGVEVRIHSERADWFEVSLRDGTTGWIPAEHAERVIRPQIDAPDR